MARLRYRRSSVDRLADAAAVLIWLRVIGQLLGFALGVLLGLAEGLRR